MEVTLQFQPAFTLAFVKVGAHEEIRIEPGAMVSHTAGMTMNTKAEGGFFGGLKRMVAGESFFQNTWKATVQGGEITLAPAIAGDMFVLPVSGDFLLASGAYVASEMSLTIDASWGGAKGFFGGGGLILLKVSGTGKLVAGSYGAIFTKTLATGESYVVDTDHIVGMDSSLNFNVAKSGSWKSTLLGGEGLVCNLTGPGRVLIQSRSVSSFVSWLLPKLPGRKTD